MKKGAGKEKNPEFFYPSFFPKTRRGLSEVITILIIIGVSIVAIGMVWVVISNLISGSSDQINTDKSSINLEISSVVTTPSGLDVVVKRNPGKGDISKLAIVVSDGSRRETFEINQTIDELQQKKFTLSYYGIIESVEIVPFLKSGSGAIIMGNSEDTLTFTPFETVQNIPGLVSWWRLEGDANDEMGMNNGRVVGAPKQVNGKYGKAYKFAGLTDWILVYDDASLRLENSNLTIVAWVNKTTSGSFGPLLIKGDVWYSAEPGYSFGVWNLGQRGVGVSFGTPSFSENFGGNFSIRKWTHISVSQQVNSPARTIKTYVGGSLRTSSTNNNVATTSSLGKNITIGINNEDPNLMFESFYGTIDEVMIFNRTLSDNEISGLYNLDLSR